MGGGRKQWKVKGGSEGLGVGLLDWLSCWLKPRSWWGVQAAKESASERQPKSKGLSLFHHQLMDDGEVQAMTILGKMALAGSTEAVVVELGKWGKVSAIGCLLQQIVEEGGKGEVQGKRLGGGF